MDYLGQVDRQLELMDISFMLTPTDDHAYLTRATAYWAAMMDYHRYSDAKRFLVMLTRHTPLSCQDEIEAMTAETYSLANVIE